MKNEWLWNLIFVIFLLFAYLKLEKLNETKIKID